MTNEEFQKVVLSELKGIKIEIVGVKDEVAGLKSDVTGLKDEVAGLKSDMAGLKDEVAELKIRVSNIETRQDEIFQVVRAIEHSNQVGKSELDNQNIRLAKVEGKMKKVAKAYTDEVDIDKASNL